jgi:hypothetical protein
MGKAEISITSHSDDEVAYVHACVIHTYYIPYIHAYIR